jgi:hypothetical protein
MSNGGIFVYWTSGRMRIASGETRSGYPDLSFSGIEGVFARDMWWNMQSRVPGLNAFPSRTPEPRCKE